MPLQDFRGFPFSRSRIENCGKDLGQSTYWKLYAIENYIRIILHSILSVQMDASWLEKSVTPKKKEHIEEMKKGYLKRPAHAMPGKHDIYYLFLSDLTKIMAESSHLIRLVIPDVDNWVVKLEAVRIPRNLVGHMNFPNEGDRAKIDTVHKEVTTLINELEAKKVLKVKIP